MVVDKRMLSYLFKIGGLALLAAGLYYAINSGQVANASTSTDEIHFTFDASTGTITGYSNNGPKDVIIPEEIAGTIVTGIGAQAFASKNLTSVVIPESVVRIGIDAFHTNKLTSVHLPSDLTVLEIGVFINNELTAVTMPDGITSIESAAFLNNKLQSVELPAQLKEISDRAFSNNELTEVVIPDGVKTIGLGAFSSNQIVALTIPDSVESVGNSAFSNNRLTSVSYPKHWTNLGPSGSAFANNLLESIVIPEGQETIGREAFDSNRLQSVTIPVNVATIGREAFRNNVLTAVTVLNKDITINSTAFVGNQIHAADLTFYGHAGSASEAYALMNHHIFRPLLAWSAEEAYTFPGLAAGYPSAAPLTVTVTKFVPGEIGQLQVALEGLNAADFEISGLGTAVLDDSHEQTSFTVRPKLGLAAGDYEAKVLLTGEYGISESFDVQFKVVTAPVTVPTAPYYPTKPSVTATGVEVWINGKAEHAGTAKTEEVNGQQVTTVAVDEVKLQQRLDVAGEGIVITIPVMTGGEVVVGELNGRMVKNMAAQAAVVEIRTKQAAYTLPVKQIDMDAITGFFGTNAAMQDIKVRIEVGAPPADRIREVEESAGREGLTLVAAPINFKVSAVYENHTVEVTDYNTYVQRSVVIPDAVDPNRVTTGVVVEPDGTIRHVPTRIIEEDGIYYAQINSLTNSTYSIVWHPLEFKDMVDHWAESSANNMGSRLVVSGTGGNGFSPNRDITRAEFAAIVVRGLGLRMNSGEMSFTDVEQSDWYSGAIHTAHEYQLIQGFADDTFRPNEKLTREQAMIIIANAMKITGLTEQLASQSTGEPLRAYLDAEDVAAWAIGGVSEALQAGIITGRSQTELAPKAFITRAEAAVIIERLLQKSGLI